MAELQSPFFPDALDPNTIAGLITDAVTRFRDPVRWAEATWKEEDGVRLLRAASNHRDDVADYLNTNTDDDIDDGDQEDDGEA